MFRTFFAKIGKAAFVTAQNQRKRQNNISKSLINMGGSKSAFSTFSISQSFSLA